MKLFDINTEIENLIDYETGEITDPDAYDNLQMARTEKLQNIALLYKNKLSDAEQLKKLEKEYAERRKRAEATAAWCKEILAFELAGEKMEDEKKRFTITWRPSKSTKTNMDLLPDEWKKVEVKPMTKEIGEALKAGQVIPGAWLEEHNNIQIK